MEARRIGVAGGSLFAAAMLGALAAPGNAHGGPPPEAADLVRRIDALTQRLAVLEAERGSPSQVTAPFKVVDKAGKVIFQVSDNPRSFHLHMPTGETVVTGSALAGGGFLKALAKDQGLQTVMGVNNNFAGFVARQGDTPRATLSIHDGGKASLEIANDNGTSVAALFHGASGGGALQLGDASNNAMVEAFVTANGTGLVRTHPLGTPGAGLVGMPGTFIIGRK